MQTEAVAPVKKTRAQIDADIERLIKALVATTAYEYQLFHAGEGVSEAHEALHIAAEKMLEMQHRLGDDLTVSNGFTGLRLHELGTMRGQLYGQQQAIKTLRASIEGELAMLRARAVGR